MERTNYWMRKASSRLSRRTVLGAAGAGAAFALVGCGGDDDDDDGSGEATTPAGSATAGASGTAAATGTSASGSPSASATEAGTPTRGGTLRSGAAFNAARGIDPHIETSVGLVSAVKIYSPLIGFNYVDNTYHTIAAESLEQPSDTEYVFKLRPGVKFQNIAPVNGREVTAEDVVFSFERFRDHPLATRNGFYKNVVASMEAIDASTFKLTTKTPYADSLGAIGVGDGFGPNACVVAPEDVEAKGDLNNGGVGSGPYMLDEFVMGEITRLVRNPDYFDPELPYLDGWTTQAITDPNTLLQAFLQDQLDFNGAALTRIDFEEMQEDDRYITSRVLSLSNSCFEMNAGEPPFNDPRVRQAMKIGMDRQQFIDKIYQGDAMPAGAIAGGHTFWALSQEEIAPYVGPDKQKAKELLAAAGYEDGFDLEIITSSGVPTYIDFAEIVVAELATLGVNATLNIMDLSTFLSEHMYAGNFPSTVWSLNAYPTLITPLGYYHKDGLGNGNWWNYANEEVSTLIDEQFATLDPDARKELVREVQFKVLDDWAPHMPIIDIHGYSVYNKRVGGTDPTLGSYQYTRYSEYIKDE